MGESAMRLGGIRRSNAAEITIRLTQQGMVISDTAGNGNFASLIPIPYCANHDLPSPTDYSLTCNLRRSRLIAAKVRGGLCSRPGG